MTLCPHDVRFLLRDIIPLYVYVHYARFYRASCSSLSSFTGKYDLPLCDGSRCSGLALSVRSPRADKFAPSCPTYPRHTQSLYPSRRKAAEDVAPPARCSMRSHLRLFPEILFWTEKLRSFLPDSIRRLHFFCKFICIFRKNVVILRSKFHDGGESLFM